MAGFLPPISVMQGLGYSRAKRRSSDMPTAFEPVKSRPSTSGWSASAAPVGSPGPCTTLQRVRRAPPPRGRPRRARAAVSGASWLGLRTTVLPASERAADGAAGERGREVEGADDGPHAVGPQDRARLLLRATGAPWADRSRRGAPSARSSSGRGRRSRSRRPSASSRLLPASRPTSAESSKPRSSISSAARRRMAARSRQGRPLQPGSRGGPRARRGPRPRGCPRGSGRARTRRVDGAAVLEAPRALGDAVLLAVDEVGVVVRRAPAAAARAASSNGAGTPRSGPRPAWRR